MTKKDFSMVWKPIVLGFLFVFLMAISFQPIFAGSREDPGSSKNLRLSLNVGFTKVNEELLNKHIHENVLINIHVPFKPSPHPWRSEFTLEVGYNEFKWDLPGLNASNQKFYWFNINPAIRLTFGKSNIKPFISAGPGIYFPKEGSARLGLKGGLGFDYQISDRFMVEIGGDYHYISLKEGNILGKSTDFFHAHGGIVFTM